MSKYIIQSKYRGSVITPVKPEFNYDGLKTTALLQNDINGVITNSQYLGYIAENHTNIAILPLTSTGRNHVPINSPAYTQPVIRAHTQPVQDFDFHPFYREKVFSCSMDKSMKIWDIPQGGLVVDIVEPTASFTTETQLPLKGLAINPVAENIVSLRGSKEVILYDCVTQQSISSTAVSTKPLYSQEIVSMCWSFDGSKVLTSSMNKNVCLLDLRLPASSMVISQFIAHTNTRQSRTLWLGDSPYFISTGQNGPGPRECRIWDSRMLQSEAYSTAVPKSLSVIDFAGCGPLIPMYDADSSLLMFMSKGDSSVSIYELQFATHTSSSEVAKSAQPMFIVKNQLPKLVPTRGAALVPKQVCNQSICEVNRILQLVDNSINPISITVPRKQQHIIHEDLYPPTFCEAPPSISREEWLNHQDPLPRQRVDLLRKATTTSSTMETGEEVGTITQDTEGNEESNTPIVTKKPSVVINSLGSMFKCRHMYGVEAPNKESTFFNLQPDLSGIESPILTCNEKYWAMPYEGGGGPVYLSPLFKYGKTQPNCPLLNGHKSSVQSIAFSPFHPDIMCTGASDCTVKVWNIPTEVEQDPSYNLSTIEPSIHIAAFNNSIRSCDFHPTVANLLVITSQDGNMKLFDITRGSADEVSSLTFENAALPAGEIVVPINVSFNYEGLYMAVACRDRMVRIVDPRVNKVVMMTSNALTDETLQQAGRHRSSVIGGNKSLGRNLRTVWCGRRHGVMGDPLVTVSSANSGMRTIHIWDPRTIVAPIQTKAIDSGSGQLIPMYDEYLNVLLVAGKGDTIIRMYEFVTPNEPSREGAPSNIESTTTSEEVESDEKDSYLKNLYFDKCNEYQTSREPIAGCCILPKRMCQVRDVEAMKLFKLTSTSVLPISFRIPRAEYLKPYFHDDIYPPVRSQTVPSATVEDFFNPLTPISQFLPVLESLQPEGMMKVSEKPNEPVPSEVKSKISVFKKEIEKNEEEKKIRDDAFTRLQIMAQETAAVGQRSGSLYSNRSSVKMGDQMKIEVEKHRKELAEEDSDDGGWNDDD